MTDAPITARGLVRLLVVGGLVCVAAGAALTAPAFDEQGPEFLGLTALGLVALGAMWRSTADGIEGVGVAGVLGLLVTGYFARFYIALYLMLQERVEMLGLLIGFKLTALVQEPDTMLRTYAVMVGALVGLAAGVLLTERAAKAPASLEDGLPSDAREQALHHGRPLLWLAAALSALTAGLHFLLIGLGTVAPDLPFRMAGALSFVRHFVVPSLALLAVWAAERSGAQPLARLGALLLVAHGIVSAILTSSRGYLLAPLASLGMLWFITGRFTRRRVKAAVMLSPLLILAFPVLSAYRQFAGGDPSEVVTGVIQALQEIETTGKELPFLSSILLAIAGRMNGFDQIAHVVAWDGVGTDGLLGLLQPAQENVTDVFTLDIIGVPPEANTAVSPSLLGYFYFRTGTVLATAICVGAWVAGWRLVVRWVAVERLRAAEVSLAMMGWAFVVLSNEGTLEGLPMLALFLAVVLLMNHVLGRPLEPTPAGA